MTEFRIEYTIQRLEPEAEDFTEIGFGSSGACSDLGDCDGGRITVFLTEITTKAARFGECGSCGTAATEWGCLCGDLNDRSVW